MCFVMAPKRPNNPPNLCDNNNIMKVTPLICIVIWHFYEMEQSVIKEKHLVLYLVLPDYEQTF